MILKAFLDQLLNSTEVQKVSNETIDNIFTLRGLIEKGEQEAAVELFKVAAFAAQSLTHLCEAKPDMFSPVAANQIAWPAMHSLHRGLLQKNNALVKSLKLAANTDINISGKGKAFSFDTPAARVALNHYNLARALRRACCGESANLPTATRPTSTRRRRPSTGRASSRSKTRSA